MGVQTTLETYRLAPQRVAGLALVAGPFENPLKTFYGFSVADRVFPVMRAVVQTAPELVRPLWSTIGPAHIGHFGARLLRAAGPKATAESLHPYLLHLGASDPAVMMATADAMRRQSAADLLPRIEAPTIVFGAGLDVFTPVACGRHMAEEIPDAEYVLFPEAGHTLPIEEPEAIAETLVAFLARRVGPVPRSAG
jgi:pimeloyl-ACP methyl ester carboxylesterase